MTPRMPMLVLVLLSALLGACTRTSTIFVKSSKETNEGRPLHMMVRTLEEPAPIESYGDVAALAYSEEKNESVLDVSVVLPGEEDLVVTLDTTGEQSVMVYFFFTNPDGDRWHVPVRAPLPEEIYIELGENEISQAQSN